ncbi:acyl-CoA thioester hydrolase [Povalibacter uvarum]|uniref:Acyl-CoA thioester hydrolase n=1 Tax=Povalibacter uvarum TaxID=732238 RepID=A0A841HSE0_9GAMM|nr:thioesterase family protein [Povalibacter uvarum]MBB6096301.1 acyl-CoA thioester hydrolase [Povalibacter uvarum]
MSEIFSCALQVGWEHLDSNAHMANTAYLDLAVNVRMRFFQASDFSLQEFERLRIGPVVRRDEIDYYREFRLLDAINATLALDGLSDDASHFRLRNEFFRADGRLAARVTISGGWLDLNLRKLTTPPEGIVRAYASLARTEGFEVLKSSLKQ